MRRPANWNPLATSDGNAAVAAVALAYFGIVYVEKRGFAMPYVSAINSTHAETLSIRIRRRNTS